MIKRALVTGGNGFLGSHVVEFLESSGYNVTILDNSGPNHGYHFYSKANKIEHDITKALELDPMNYDVVFHCAGLLGTETLFNRIREAAMVNIIGTINVLDWARGNPDIYVVQPNLLGEWANIYMISKHCAEDIGLMYHKQFDVKYLSVRPSDVYGPRQRMDEKKAAPLFIDCAYSDRNMHIYGDGTSWVNYVYVTDVAEFLVKAYEAGACGEIVDFCYPGGDMGIADFARKVIEVTKTSSKLEYGAMRPGQPGNVYRIEYNLRRAGEIVDMLNLRDLTYGITETMSWYVNSQMD